MDYIIRNYAYGVELRINDDHSDHVELAIIGDVDNIEHTTRLDKTQLREFIGALLHVQSKGNKK